MSLHPQTPQSPSQSSPPTNATDAVCSVNSNMASSFTPTLLTPAHSINGTTLPSDAVHDIKMTGNSPNKRKRENGDAGEQEREKRVHMDGGAVAGAGAGDQEMGDANDEAIPPIQAIHEDVGEKYLLLKKKWEPAMPLLSDDLFEVYGLTGIAGEVARVLPDGSKNAMRKTYKGHIKRLGLTGHFDAVKKEPNDPDGFLNGLIDVPQEDWHHLQVQGKEIGRGLRPEVQRILPKATTMARGPISKEKWDKSVLADFAGSSKGIASAKATAPGTPLNPALNAVSRATKTQGIVGSDAARPRRAGKKRSYGDSSFEGYGDFLDDETGAETGYSTGEGEGTKRRKKVLHALFSHCDCSTWNQRLLTHRRMLSPALAPHAWPMPTLGLVC